MAESGFNIQEFIEESKRTLKDPKGYFSSMTKEGGFGEPIIKALIYGTVGGIINLIWSLLNLSGSAMMGNMFGTGAGGITILIGSIIAAIIGLFIGGIIILIISAICGGSTDFESNIRVTASLMALTPVNAFLSVFMSVNLYLGGLASLLVSLYGIYLLFIALINALEAKEKTAKAVSAILAVIPIVMLASALMCAGATNQYMNNMIKNMPDAAGEDFQNKMKLMEERMKKLQKQ